MRSKTQWAAVRTCLLEIRAPEQARPREPEGAVVGAPPTSMPTAEKGKSSVSATAVLSDEKKGLTEEEEEEEEGEEEEDRGATEAVLMAALAISTASSEMFRMP